MDRGVGLPIRQSGRMGTIGPIRRICRTRAIGPRGLVTPWSRNMAYRHAAVVWVLGGICLLAGEVSGDLQVGAYYYPWYGDFPGGHRLTQSLRGHLVPQQPPAIGLYSNRAAETVEAHLDQSRQANIDFWALSWWGPSSAEDRTIREHLLSHERAGELRYAIHYESTGRFGPFDNPDFSPLLPDFRYLAENYFGREDYLHIDGRPVVFLYVTRAYFNTAASRRGSDSAPRSDPLRVRPRPLSRRRRRLHATGRSGACPAVGRHHRF